jgi:hypothetical protein
MKQTAVEYLMKFCLNDLPIEQWNKYNGLFQQAKEMEKKQCGRSFNSGYNRCEWDNSVGSCYDEEPKEFEQYYNETYGSKGSDETKQ